MRKRDIIKKKLKSITEKDILVAMRDTLDSAYVLFKKKLGDYGVETYKAAGGIGVITRINEKFYRMDNLLRTGGQPNCESIRDTIQDLSVYATTLTAMIDKGLVDLDELHEQYMMIYGEKDDSKDEKTDA